MTPKQAWDLATGERQQYRLGGLLVGYDRPDEFPANVAAYTLRPVRDDMSYWYIYEVCHGSGGGTGRPVYVSYADEVWCRSNTATSARPGIAVATLEQINSPASQQQLKALGDGHEKGSATVAAKAAFERLRAEPPTAKPPADLWKGDRTAWGKPQVLNQLLAQPKETVAFLKQTLRPLQLTEDEAKALLAKLFSEDANEWKAALVEMKTFDVRLAMNAQDAWKIAKTHTARGRLRTLFCVLSGSEHLIEKDGFDIDAGNAGKDYALLPPTEDWPEWYTCPFPRGGVLPKERITGAWGFEMSLSASTLTTRWQREEVAVRVLDAIGTDDAIAVVKAMATGHKDAGPTRVANEVLERRGVK
jgi:hypothetical protein